MVSEPTELYVLSLGPISTSFPQEAVGEKPVVENPEKMSRELGSFWQPLGSLLQPTGTHLTFVGGQSHDMHQVFCKCPQPLAYEASNHEEKKKKTKNQRRPQASPLSPGHPAVAVSARCCLTAQQWWKHQLNSGWKVGLRECQVAIRCVNSEWYLQWSFQR